MGFNKTLGQAFIIILLAIASYHLLHENNHSSSTTLKTKKNQKEKPSAFISNGEFTIYDKEGNATNFSSKKARYFSNPKRILIDYPSISFDTNDNQTITLNAKEGIFHPEEEKLLLKGEVIIQRLLPINTALTPNSKTEQLETWDTKKR